MQCLVFEVVFHLQMIALAFLFGYQGCRKTLKRTMQRLSNVIFY